MSKVQYQITVTNLRTFNGKVNPESFQADYNQGNLRDEEDWIIALTDK